MAWLLTILSLIVLGVILWRYLHLKRLVLELEDAARTKRRFIPREANSKLRRLGIEGLIRELNDSIDRENHNEARKAGYNTQVQAMLRAVQEVVIVFNSERKVEFANRAAEHLFRNGQSLKGLKLEGQMRSLALLELLQAPDDEDAEPQQISIEQENRTLWFEASFARVKTRDTTLLVMHDITRLKRLEEMRRDFVANVSHELRTPLTIIKGFAETLVEDELTIKAEARSRFLGKIVTNADRLNVLVEDLLTLSRLESKPDQLDLTPHSLKEFLEEIIENYRGRIDADRQELSLIFHNALKRFAFDRYALNQVFDNLIENAFRYAPDFTKLLVEVRLDENAKWVTCSIYDDGPGIPDRDLPNIFGRFYRVDKGRSRERGGTGLGLSIVKHIIQLHGGTIHAESEIGKWTKMTFTLPYQEQTT